MPSVYFGANVGWSVTEHSFCTLHVHGPAPSVLLLFRGRFPCVILIFNVDINSVLYSLSIYGAIPSRNKTTNPWTSCLVIQKSRDSSVGTALGYGLENRGSGVRFSAGAGNFSLNHRVQNGSGAHPASYPMGTRSSFPGGKAAGAWSWPLTSISCPGQRMSGAIPPLAQ
jgi:hypothetical protein